MKSRILVLLTITLASSGAQAAEAFHCDGERVNFSNYLKWKALGKVVALQSGHDLEKLLAGTSKDYVSVRPLTPAESFQSGPVTQPDGSQVFMSGRDHVRQHYTRIFGLMSDFTVTVQKCVIDASGEVWSEQNWHGTMANGQVLNWNIATVYEFDSEGLLAKGTLYMPSGSEIARLASLPPKPESDPKP